MASDRRGNPEHRGRVTVSECPVHRGEQCAPRHRVTTWPVDGGRVKDRCTCTCGRRFPVTTDGAAAHLVDPIDPGAAVEVPPGRGATWTMAADLPPDAGSPIASPGVVPVETPVLHVATEPVGAVTREIKALVKHMVRVMHRAPGVGLAANQVGVGLRLFVQVHKGAAPEALVDPEIRASDGTWTYTEGCLSLVLDDAHAPVDRPRRVQVRARTVHGEVVEVTADGILARILQHEIDHLDGIEYVQRLVGEHHDRVYGLMADAGLDVDCVPPTPY